MSTLAHVRGDERKQFWIPPKRTKLLNLALFTLFCYKINKLWSYQCIICMHNSTDVCYHQIPQFILMWESFNCVGIHAENTTCSKTGKIIIISESTLSITMNIVLFYPAEFRGKLWLGRKCLFLVDEYSLSAPQCRDAGLWYEIIWLNGHVMAC